MMRPATRNPVGPAHRETRVRHPRRFGDDIDGRFNPCLAREQFDRLFGAFAG